MCTVTFIPKENTHFILTSNRDEAPNRETHPPQNQAIKNHSVLAPQDALAGGTWIGSSSKNRTLCLLNGGFTMHQRKKSHTQSRGLVVRELLVADDLFAAIEHADYAKVEPFTLVIVNYEITLTLHELVWDGNEKHLKKLPNKPTVWSSSTLYSEQMKIERKNWFQEFVTQHTLTNQQMLDFHWNTKKDNKEYGVVMDRFFVKTTSTTQIEKFEDGLIMTYYDLQTEKKFVEKLQLIQTVE